MCVWTSIYLNKHELIVINLITNLSIIVTERVLVDKQSGSNVIVTPHHSKAFPITDWYLMHESLNQLINQINNNQLKFLTYQKIANVSVNYCSTSRVSNCS